jgi:hypothetical protein
MVEDNVTCAICLSQVISGEQCVLPDCKHTFHTVCALNFIQYDTRCPICRKEPNGITKKNDTEHIAESIRHHVQDLHLQWRRYTQRRRRYIKTRPQICEAEMKLKSLNQQINSEMLAAQKLYDQKCKEIWLNDNNILLYKENMRRMRRRQRRLTSLIETAIQDIGPKPDRYISVSLYTPH